MKRSGRIPAILLAGVLAVCGALEYGSAVRAEAGEAGLRAGTAAETAAEWSEPSEEGETTAQVRSETEERTTAQTGSGAVSGTADAEEVVAVADSSSEEEEVIAAEPGSEAAADSVSEGESYAGVLYEAADPDADAEEPASAFRYGDAEVATAAGVTQEMCAAEYWYDKSAASGITSGEELITIDEIKKLNAQTLQNEEANMYDLTKLEGTYNADERRKSLAAGTTTTRTVLFADGEAVDPAAYYQTIADAILESGYTGEEKALQYAVASKRTTVRNIPVDAYIGYSATDSDDEKILSALCVGEAFVIGQMARVDGKDYYWGYSDVCTGWVDAADLAICVDKEEWLEAWQVEPGEDDFLVVTQNQITLEPSLSRPELSEVKLTFATILKTVPKEDYPVSIGERGPWYNYVVYLPVRDAEGKYHRTIALISKHYEVSAGFLKMTQEEILRVAFNNLGDRYGWGGMLDSMDCSLFTRAVYRCFGLNLPRNTTWQQKVPGRRISLEELSDEEKQEAIRKMPAGTLLFFPGHLMLYTGYAAPDGGEEFVYVISDTGSLRDSTEEAELRSMYSIILNPLTVRRGNGSTWLSNLTAAVLPISAARFAFVSENIADKKGPAAEGQTYASSADTLPLETFLGTAQNMYISFYQAADSGAVSLRATVLKGSVLTTKMPVNEVRCEKQTASFKLGKTNGLATVTLKKSGRVSFVMKTGETFDVDFTVETPAAQNAAVKKLVAAAPAGGTVSLGIKELFGTQLDGGTLRILSQKKGSARLEGKQLVLTKPKEGSDTVKLRYAYLNKSWSMTITVK